MKNIFTCHLTLVPLRSEPSHRSELVSQIFFGETFELLEEGQEFSKIRLLNINYEGWIQNYQFGQLSTFNAEQSSIIGIQGGVAKSDDHIIQLLHGTPIINNRIEINNKVYEISGEIIKPSLLNFELEFKKLIQFYKDTPYLWGGRSKYGIDCSGFSQLVYSHFGIELLRDAWQQATLGKTVDFLTEIKAGDLAFFDNDEGRITHVGIMIDKDLIIHASTQVRIDKMDSQGIYNADLNKYTHKLRIIKRYF